EAGAHFERSQAKFGQRRRRDFRVRVGLRHGDSRGTGVKRRVKACAILTRQLSRVTERTFRHHQLCTVPVGSAPLVSGPRLERRRWRRRVWLSSSTRRSVVASAASNRKRSAIEVMCSGKSKKLRTNAAPQ